MGLLLPAVGFAEPASRLHYVFTPEAGKLRVAVLLEGVREETDLVLPSASGEAAGLERGIAAMRLTPAKGRARLAYELIQDWQGDSRESVRHRPHVDASHFEINTANAIVHPKLDLAQRVDCTFEWRLPAGWTLATSFGAAVSNGEPIRQRFRGAWNEVQNAMFAAGDFRLLRSKVGNGELVLALRGPFAFSDAEAAGKIEKLILLQRHFWRDPNVPYFLVTLSPFAPGQSSSGGSGFTNAFNLYTSSDAPFSDGLLSLISHETFHAWNPLKLGRIRHEQSIKWFTEGFTTFYQDLLLWQNNLIGTAAYLEPVNRIVREQSRSPYERGAAIALWLDFEIRRRSSGKFSLDSVMRDLYEGRRKHPDLSNERILAAIARYANAGTMQRLRAALDGGPIETPPKLRAICAEPRMVAMYEFDLGMDRAALLETNRVKALAAGSEAERAGLREGDRVRGMSIHWNDTGKPVKLTLTDGRRTEYLPRGRALGSVPQYVCP